MPSIQALKEIAFVFLKLGLTAFGGPAAHIAMMQEEVVTRRKWLSREHLLDLLGASNLIPGPNSTELAIHIGYHRAGWKGLLVAGTCFILPAALMVSAIAWAYVTYGQLPAVSAILHGIKPVIVAVVLQALVVLGRTALKSRFLWLVGVIAAVCNFCGVNEILIVFASGVVMYLVQRPPNNKSIAFLFSTPFGGPNLPVTALPVAITKVSLGGLWLFFAKVGSVLFGSGYVLLAFLRSDLVEKLGWLTEQQLLDATAVGQFTPGPVFTTATFIGYILAGPAGAFVSTLGIFLPAFFFVALTAPWIHKLRCSPELSAFLDGVNVASLALMVVVTWYLARSTFVDGLSMGIFIVSFGGLLKLRINSAWLVFFGGFLGWASALFL